MRYGTTLVAAPTQTTRTPVASGSSVPAWPTRFSESARRTRATTSKEVSSRGLSTTMIPETGCCEGMRGSGRKQQLERGVDGGQKEQHAERQPLERQPIGEPLAPEEASA